MDALLQVVDSFATSEDSESLSRDVLSACSQMLHAHGDAFEKGLIPCARLVEVLAPPFLKLSRKANRVLSSQEHPTPSNQSTKNADLKLFLSYWDFKLHDILVGDSDTSRQEGKIQQVLSLKKRQELEKSLVAAKFPEVRGC